MAETKDILAYFLKHYPYKEELSNARVTKMVYLADWRHAIQTGQQITPIQWVFNNYGPFVWDVKEAADANPSVFAVEQGTNAYGSPKALMAFRPVEYTPRLTPSEQDAAEHVIKATKHLGWDAFIRLVYSTYPIIRCQRYTELDLPALAREYNQSVRNHPAAVIG